MYVFYLCWIQNCLLVLLEVMLESESMMLPAGGRQHHGYIIPQTVTHSLVLLKMGKIISRNILS